MNQHKNPKISKTALRRKQKRKRELYLKLSCAISITFAFALLFVLYKTIDHTPKTKEPSSTINSLEVHDPIEYHSGSVPELVANFAKKNQIPLSAYPTELLEMLKKNPETEEFVLNYPLKHKFHQDFDLSHEIRENKVPLLMQWDTRWGYISYAGEVAGLSGCGPLCLSMVGLHLTGNQELFRPDKVLKFAELNNYCIDGNGSKWSLIEQGGKQLGLDVTELPLDRARIERNLEVNNPIICVVGPGIFTTTGHFIILTGMKDGKIMVNDPNSYKNSSRLWEYEEIESQIKNLWAIRYFQN